MMKTTSLFVLASLGSLSMAQSTPPYLPLFASPYGNETVVPNNGYDTFLAAGKNPNATHAVSFDYVPYTSPGENWTWTLGISDVPMANHSNTTQDAHVAYVTYDFAWPGGDGNLNDAIDRIMPRNGDASSNGVGLSCLYLFYAVFPQNVSDAWDSSSSDCTSAFGEACVGELTSALTSGRDGSCGSANLAQFSNGACANSTALATGVVASVNPFGNASAPSNASSIQSGDTYAWSLSFPYAPDSQGFEAAEGMLRVIGLTAASESRVFCNRVSKSNGTSTAASPPSSTSSAPQTSSSPHTGAATREYSVRMTIGLSVMAVVAAFIASV